ncbi:MAG TPA: hypothetical protein G4O03_00425 [Dehalococcoidia bacterium]|nr:hypothetical protein [Dehalococcoidia bacterium]
MVILVVGAHPDDIELGLGATIHKFREVHQIHGLVLTSGGWRGRCEEREQATVQAAEILGYTPHFGRLEDAAFTDTEAEQAIRQKIAELKPDLVICHSSHEHHRDHQIAHLATLSASRRLPMLLFFEGPYTRGFEPQLYVPVGDTDLEAKIEALREHAKVVEIRQYLEKRTVKALAIARGATVTTAYAEAFVVDRLINGPFSPRPV